MNAQISIDLTSILQMAFVACLVAGLLPSRLSRAGAATGGPAWRTEVRSGMVRAACGILVAVSSWSTIQVVGGAFDGSKQIQAQMNVPIVVLPHQGNGQPQPYGPKRNPAGDDI